MENPNPTIFLKSRPHGEPTPANFELRPVPMPPARAGEVRYQTMYLSIDPYLRGRMNDGKSYIPPFQVGQAFESGVVGKVTHASEGFAEGDLVAGIGTWSRFGSAPATGLTKLPPGLPPTLALGVLGMPGLTAYVGLIDIGKPKAGETVVVSAAAGAVGALVGQLAKLRGCRAVGLAGSREKCAYVVGELGFDACIDYRKEDVSAALSRTCPDGIDIYFDNVGGPIFAAALEHLRDHARIPLCGMISEYNAASPPPGPNLRPLLVHKAMIQAFIVLEHFDRLPAFLEEVTPHVLSGKIKHHEDVVDGLEKAPEALIGLLRGTNFGKLVIKV